MRFRTALGAVSLLALSVAAAHAQSSLLQGGPFAPGRVPMYVGNGDMTQPVVQDSGPAGGGGPGVGLSELGLTVQGTGSAPYANAGTGPLGTNLCDYDAPITNAAGYHYLCISPNAQGGGLITYGAGGGASQLPLTFSANGVSETFPFTGGSISGPANTLAIFNSVGALASSAYVPTVNVPGFTGGQVTSTAGSLALNLVSGAAIANIGNQAANTVLAGPTSGAAALPAFRSLIVGDISGLGSGVGTAFGLGVNTAGGFPTTDSNNTLNAQLLQVQGAIMARSLVAMAEDKVNVRNIDANAGTGGDDNAAVTEALSLVANGGAIYFPGCATYKVTENLAVALANTKHINILGDGASCSKLFFSGSPGFGLTVTWGGPWGSVNAAGITFTTDQTDQTQPLFSIVNPNTYEGLPNLNFGTNNLYDVGFEPNDRWTASNPTDYPGTAFYAAATDALNVWGGYCNLSPVSLGGTCYSVNGNSSGVETVIANFYGTGTFNCGTGFYYGSYVEGVYLNNFQSTGCQIGVDTSTHNHDQLIVSASQFEDIKYQIRINDPNFNDLEISNGSLFIIGGYFAWCDTTMCAGQTYTANTIIAANSNLYEETVSTCTPASSGSGPSGTGAGIADNTCSWNYAGPSNTASWTSGTYYTSSSIAETPVSVYKQTVAQCVSATSGAGPSGTGTGIADGTCSWNYIGPNLTIYGIWSQGIGNSIQNSDIVGIQPAGSKCVVIAHSAINAGGTNISENPGIAGCGQGITLNSDVYNGYTYAQLNNMQSNTNDFVLEGTAATAWATSTGYTAGNVRTANSNLYTETAATCTSASTGSGPSGPGSGIVDNTCSWNYSAQYLPAGGLYPFDVKLRNLSAFIPCSLATYGAMLLQADSNASAWNGVAANDGSSIMPEWCDSINWRNH